MPGCALLLLRSCDHGSSQPHWNRYRPLLHCGLCCLWSLAVRDCDTSTRLNLDSGLCHPTSKGVVWADESSSHQYICWWGMYLAASGIILHRVHHRHTVGLDDGYILWHYHQPIFCWYTTDILRYFPLCHHGVYVYQVRFGQGQVEGYNILFYCVLGSSTGCKHLALYSNIWVVC